ncbi:MAG: hypothetical protein AAFY73_01415 [Pseudomonadota bacterium]
MLAVAAALFFALLSALSGFASVGSEARSQKARLIVSRSNGYVEVYLLATGQDVFGLFQVDPADFSLADGAFDFEAVQQHTSGAADAFAAQATLISGDQSVVAEGISFAAHPPDRVMPFDDPYEALGVIGFCSVEVRDLRIATNDIGAYLGIIAKVGTDGPTVLRLPGTLAKPWTLEIVEYDDAVLSASYTTILPAGAVATFAFFEETGPAG